MTTDSELKKLTSEINQLKKRKQRELALSSSIQERNKLLREISQLEAIKKSPSKLKSFSKTFGRGLKMTGKTLWSGISKASRNLNRNAPEFKEMSKGMTSSPMDMYVPKAQMKTPKLKKGKKKKLKKGFRITDKASNPMSWQEFP